MEDKALKQYHQNQAIHKAIQEAVRQGWRFERSKGHAFGKLYCPWNSVNCGAGLTCVQVVYSTPRNPEGHARQILRRLRRCQRLNTTGP